MLWGFILGVAVGVIFYPQIIVGVRKAVLFIKHTTESGEEIVKEDKSKGDKSKSDE